MSPTSSRAFLVGKNARSATARTISPQSSSDIHGRRPHGASERTGYGRKHAYAKREPLCFRCVSVKRDIEVYIPMGSGRSAAHDRRADGGTSRLAAGGRWRREDSRSSAYPEPGTAADSDRPARRPRATRGHHRFEPRSLVARSAPGPVRRDGCPPPMTPRQRPWNYSSRPDRALATPYPPSADRPGPTAAKQPPQPATKGVRGSVPRVRRRALGRPRAARLAMHTERQAVLWSTRPQPLLAPRPPRASQTHPDSGATTAAGLPFLERDSEPSSRMRPPTPA